MKFNRERLMLEKNKEKMERQEKVAKWELQQMVVMHSIELEKEKLRLARETEESRIMLQDINLLDEEGNKWLLHMKKSINACGN